VENEASDVDFLFRCFCNTCGTHAGSTDVMVRPALDFTNSLLMKRPVGCVYLTPFGAVSSTDGARIVSGSTTRK
jgi:hypothetical protein